MRVLALFGLFSLLAAFPPLPCLPMAGVPDMKRDRNEEEGALFEGDILLGPGEDIASKNLLLNPEIRWPNRTLYYEISDEYNEEQRSAIIRAISDLQKVTCVRLVPRTEDQQAYLVIRNVYGCASPVGFHRGRRELRLHFPGCFTRGTIQHEFFHALGFWHEHSRGDRDDYIRIMWENIRKGAEHNFVARAQSEVHLLGMPYDYNSVMHYRSTAFSKDGRSSTIVPLKPQVAIGQRLRYSKIDLAKLNRLYNCDGYYKGEDVPGARPAMPFTDKPAAQNPSENMGQNASTQSQSTQQYTTSPSTHGHSPTPNQQVQSTINQNPGQDNQNQSQNKQHQVNNQNQAHNKPNQTHNNHNQAQNAGYAFNSQVQSYPSRIQRHDSFHRPQSSSNDDIQFDSSSQYSNNERNQGNNYYGSQQNPQQYSSNSRRHNMNPNQQRNAEQFSNQQPYSNYGYQQQQSNQRGYGYGNQATNRYNNQPVNFQVKRSTNYARHMPQRNNNERGNYGGGHSSRRPQNQLRNNRGGCSSSENQNNDRGYTNEDYNNEEHQQEQNNNCRESSQSNNSGRRRNHGSSSSGRYPSRGHDQQYPNSRRNNSPQNSNQGQQYPRDNNHRKTSDSNSGYQYQQPESTNNNGGNSNNRNRQQHHQNESDMSEPTPSKEEERYHIKQEYFSGNQNTKNKDADLLSKVESEVGGSDE